MEVLITFFIAVFFLALSPGPDNIYVLSISITKGLKYGIITTLGLMTGCVIHTLFLAFGFTLVIKENNTLFTIVKTLGGLYFLFLAYKVYKNRTEFSLINSGDTKSVLKSYKIGVIMNLLNPKVSLFFLAFFPNFLFSEQLEIQYQFLILGFCFIIVSFSVFSLIAIASAKFRNIFIANTKSVSFLKWLQLGVLIALGIFILFQEK